MRRALFALGLAALLLPSCRGEGTKPFLPEPTDTREPIAMRYVTGPKLPVHVRADEGAEVVITYQRGERVSILAEQGDWVEVRIGDGSGWARREHVGSAAEAGQDTDQSAVRFERPPANIISMTASGEIYIEADVNTDGDVVSTRIITNTTGNEALALHNEAALRQAKFYPIVRAGERQPFKYYYRVTY
ncbi:MAG TPA: SH3 domain-containing protein [Thermoanaerobaculia bacterium]|nr:SH3 domain-containing protein [Thermoanaerobaculia bacterium]